MLKSPVLGVGTFEASDRAKELVMQALDANRLSYGPLTEQFEARLARLHGCRFGIMSNSGTSSLQVALAALKEMHNWSDGDEVLVPAMTFVATSNIAQLEDWKGMIQHRRANARRLSRELAVYADRIQLPAIRPGSDHSFVMYPIVLRDQPKPELINYLEARGVETRDMLPLVNQPVYHQLLQVKQADYPVADWTTENGFYIGCHQNLTEGDLEYVAELFARFWKRDAADAHTQSAALVLIVGDHWDALLDMLDALPLDLFNEVIALSDHVPEIQEPAVAAAGIRVEPLNRQDPLGFLESSEKPVDNVILYPADGSYDARDIAKARFSLENSNDMVIASRFLPGGMRHDRDQRLRYRSLGNRVFTLLANLIYYGNLTDSLCQFRGMKRERLLESGYVINDWRKIYGTAIHAMRSGWRLAEIPTQEAVVADDISKAHLWGSAVSLVMVLVRSWFRKTKA